MNQQTIIADIETRAKAVGVSILSLLGDAGIAPTTYYRWRDGSDAKLVTLNRLADALAAYEKQAA